jgi:multiple sugar transport system ATP-binding protein
MIELRNVTRRFGAVTVLDGISLEAAEGAFVALLGPSGCGKSTLLRIVAGLDRPTSGEVRFLGRDVRELSAAERNVAMVFQNYALYPHLTVAENIALPLAMRELSRLDRSLLGRLLPAARARRAGIRARAAETAGLLDIAPLLDRKPAQLSGGQKQRVAVARALVRDPSVFLLDEPLSNLDAKLRVQMRAEIVALNRRTGRTFVYVTHDQAEAMAMADRVAVMLDGRIAQAGPPRALYETPATREVAAFVGTHPINLVRGPKTGGLPPPFDRAGIACPDGTAVVVGIRPEHLTPRANGPLAGQLVHAEYQGAELLLDIAFAAGTTLRAAAAGDWRPPPAGTAVRLGFEPRHLHLFDEATGGRIVVDRDEDAARCAS